MELYFLQVIDVEENKEKLIELEQISIQTTLTTVVRLSIYSSVHCAYGIPKVIGHLYIGNNKNQIRCER